jgi:hypothetical protein
MMHLFEKHCVDLYSENHEQTNEKALTTAAEPNHMLDVSYHSFLVPINTMSFVAGSSIRLLHKYQLFAF